MRETPHHGRPPRGRPHARRRGPAARRGPGGPGRLERAARRPAPSPTPAATAAAAGAGQAGRGQAAPGHLRLRHARHGLPDGPEPPRLVRRAAADQAAVVRERVRRGRPLLRRRPPEPSRREGLHPDRRRRDQDASSSSSSSAPVSTPARRRSACATPGASSASSAPARRGARSWTPTCSRTRSSTGARPGWSFFRNVQVRWTPWQKGDSRFTIALERPGASADQGVYAGRIELAGRARAASRRPTSRPHFRYAKDWGHVQVGRHRALDQVGRHERRPVRPLRRRHRLGLQPQHEPQVREARVPRLGGLRRGHRRTT